MTPKSPLIIELTRDQDRQALCRVTISEIGWDVAFEVDGRVLSIKHCGDWHRVERICDSMWAQAHTLAPDRR